MLSEWTLPPTGYSRQTLVLGGGLAREQAGADPAGIVFGEPIVIVELGARLIAVALVVHSVPGERVDDGAQFGVEISVFVPADGVEEEVARVAGELRGQDAGGKPEC